VEDTGLFVAGHKFADINKKIPLSVQVQHKKTEYTSSDIYPNALIKKK
jgi:hypothetical protein